MHSPSETRPGALLVQLETNRHRAGQGHTRAEAAEVSFGNADWRSPLFPQELNGTGEDNPLGRARRDRWAWTSGHAISGLIRRDEAMHEVVTEILWCPQGAPVLDKPPRNANLQLPGVTSPVQ